MSAAWRTKADKKSWNNLEVSAPLMIDILKKCNRVTKNQYVKDTWNSFQILALFDEQHDCLYSTRYESVEFDLSEMDFLSMDCFGEKIDARTKLRAYEESLLSGEASNKRKYNDDEEMSFLDTREDIFLRGDTSAIGNLGLERIGELRSRLSHDRAPARSPKPKKPKTTNDEPFAMPKVYACQYCPAKFYSKIASHHHQVCHAKKSLRCPYCNKRSRSISGFRRHTEYYHCTRRTREVIFDYR